ncbi:aromatic ring-hydroxylating dioxygenase subunit alpha [Hydrogenophaga sp. 2FB]|uniref:aromatic ring-hydroxylating oxygenase subunit alpha n=1 Tax=Hydrogenophaga sp. 2FB TaxID=2502187 RepID=UPI0010F64E62|nr:aromatic ring-hydroxylating dioxygenase subunit alpha [Hydrogenophaga sp. 2FB]
MAFQTTDDNFLNDWLTLGPVARLKGTTHQNPRKTQLLGAPVGVWLDDSGAAHVTQGQAELLTDTRYGYVWACPSGQPAKPLFAFPEHGEPGRRIVDCDGIGVSVSGLRMVENFLDMGHFPYVHTGYLGKVPHTEVTPYKVQVEPDTQEIWATDCEFFQPKTSATATTGLQAAYRFRVMQPMTAMLYKSCFNREDTLDAIALFVQPLTEESCIAYVLLAYFEDQLSDTELIAFQHTIFGQDKPILENQRPKRMPLAPTAEIPARCDATSVAFRRWLRSRNVSFGALPA